jgi:hypothetical protein
MASIMRTLRDNLRPPCSDRLGMPTDGLGDIRGARSEPRDGEHDNAELPAKTDGAFLLTRRM